MTEWAPVIHAGASLLVLAIPWAQLRALEDADLVDGDEAGIAVRFTEWQLRFSEMRFRGESCQGAFTASYEECCIARRQAWVAGPVCACDCITYMCMSKHLIYVYIYMV
jgi:hypothetical protein